MPNVDVALGLTQTREAHARSTEQRRPAAKSNDWHLCDEGLQARGPWQSLKLLQLSPIRVPGTWFTLKGWQVEPATVLQKKPVSQLSGECPHVSPLLRRARAGAAVAGTGRGAVTAGAATSGATATGATTTGATGTGAATGALALSFEVSRVEMVHAEHAVTIMTAEQMSRQTR